METYSQEKNQMTTAMTGRYGVNFRIEHVGQYELIEVKNGEYVQGGPLQSYRTTTVANKQTHAKPFQRLLPVGWGFGQPLPTYRNHFVNCRDKNYFTMACAVIMDKRNTNDTISSLDDVEIEKLFRILGLELIRRNLMVHSTVAQNDKVFWIYCGDLDEFEEDGLEEDGLEEDELLDYDSSEDEDTYVDDYDDWSGYGDSESTRTPNDDRSDSMNPNSHRYNPGR